ncbi:MAG: hypothetical protein OR996_07120, partial [Phycisphaerales bacterium]|nr:hypothetical protein [Phycisphaerales bacterium]
MRKRIPFITAVFATLALANVATAQAPAPPSDLSVQDTPDDSGKSVDLQWSLSNTDIFNPLLADVTLVDPSTIVATYSVERITSLDANGKEVAGEDSQWRVITEAGAGDASFVDRTVELDWTYNYRICAIDNQGDASNWVEAENTVIPEMQMFDFSKAWLAIFMLVFGGFVVYFINEARSGKTLWVRKIAGLEAIDEAVGRATEMGRPVLFVTGIQDINEIQTLAGLTVLSRVAKTAAEYGAQIEVPTCRSLVMAAARETVESAYLAAGAPDAYQPDKIHYLTDEQFAFVAGVTGYMVREEPAACIYMGGFYAESLILAETGNHIGAIQVAGTAMPSQLPFFVASCDYTLIGEEFFAASAYLSGVPLQIGSLKGQD